MTTKAAIIATLATLVGVVGVGLLLLLLFVDPNARNAQERGKLLGEGLALLCMLPLGAIWILWAARFRKEREAKQNQQMKRKTR
jgi:hypothetical protein